MDTRPPPPTAPPPYAFVTRVYRRNLRPIVITIAFLGAIWALFSGIAFFRNSGVYRDNGSSKLALFAIILGILFMVVLAIEVFGVFASSTQKLPFVRIYAYLAGLAALIVAACGLIRIVVHFTLKGDIIGTCTNASEGATFVTYAGWWGPVRTDVLNRDEAARFCDRYWSRDSWSEVVGFLITSFLAVFFAILAFNYLHQVMDPSSPANYSREPQNNHGFQSAHYAPYNPNPGYGPGYGPQTTYGPQTGYPGYNQGGYQPSYTPQFAPPTGPPPANSGEYVPPYPGKPPGFVGGDDHKGGYGDAQKSGPEGPSAERDVTSPRTTNPFS